MDIFVKIAEQRIREAMENGEFNNLSGMGKPLDFSEDVWVPQDLRMCYRILKNAGCLPPELELRNEIISLRDLINTVDDDQVRLKKLRELNYKLLKLNELRKKPVQFEKHPEYEDKIYKRIIG